MENAVNETIKNLEVNPKSVDTAKKIFDDMMKDEEKLWIERNKRKLLDFKELEKELEKTKDGFISAGNDELKKELENRWSTLNARKQKLQLELDGKLTKDTDIVELLETILKIVKDPSEVLKYDDVELLHLYLKTVFNDQLFYSKNLGCRTPDLLLLY